MKKKMSRKGQTSIINKESRETLILELDENKNWMVKIQDKSGVIIKSNMRYTERELERNFDLKIQVHNHSHVEEYDEDQ